MVSSPISKRGANAAITVASVLRQLVLSCGLTLLLLTTKSEAQTTPGCINTIDSFAFIEFRFNDFLNYKEYIFCENKVYEVGQLDYSHQLIPGTGSPPIQLRPNLHLKCGATGSRDNNCLILGGDLQLDGTSYFGMSSEFSLFNVTIEGFTFGVSSKYSTWLTKAGNVTFIDCEWRDHQEAVSPIYLDYFNATDPHSRLLVNFIECDFKDNIYYGEGSVPAIITANGEQNTMVFERCVFSGNDFIFNNTNFLRNSFLIETSGELHLDRNCFTDNLVGVSPVVSYAAEVVSTLNYGSTSDGRRCSFVSRFETQSQYDFFSPICVNYEEVTTCLSDNTFAPSMGPTGTPTGSPTLSRHPSSFPTATITQTPTGSPSTTPPTALVPAAAPSTPATPPPTPSPAATPTAAAPTTTPAPNTASPTVEGFVAPPTPQPTDGVAGTSDSATRSSGTSVQMSVFLAIVVACVSSIVWA